MTRTRDAELLLGEWACLGILVGSPAHGYDVAARLAPTGDVGRVWTLSRPLTYRALDQLVQRGLIEVVGEERGTAGGNRTILATTTAGAAAIEAWLQAPVRHLRDVRGELLLKLVLCDLAAVDPRPVLQAQRNAFAPVADALAIEAASATGADLHADAVAVWRSESSRAVLRFLDRMLQRPVP